MSGGILHAWWFVAAAYAIAIGGTIALLGWSVAAARRAERDADRITRR